MKLPEYEKRAFFSERSFSHGDPYKAEFRFTVLRTALRNPGNLPRPEKQSPGLFFTPLRGAGLKVNCCAAAREGGLGHSIPTQIIMKKRAPAKAGARFFMVTRTGIEPMLPP